MPFSRCATNASYVAVAKLWDDPSPGELGSRSNRVAKSNRIVNTRFKSQDYLQLNTLRPKIGV